MRDIKFRAWHESDGANGKMIYQREATVPESILFWKSVYYDAIFMQYKGIKDKNGIEIFEGDVCKIEFNIQDVEDSVYMGLSDKEIKEQSKTFVVENPLFNNQIEFTANIIEVIGNIHENKSLLV